MRGALRFALSLCGDGGKVVRREGTAHSLLECRRRDVLLSKKKIEVLYEYLPFFPPFFKN